MNSHSASTGASRRAEASCSTASSSRQSSLPQQRVIAGGLEVAVVSALLLLAIHRDLGGVHVQYDALWGMEGFRLGDQFAVDAGQAAEVLVLGQHLGLKGPQARGQRRLAMPSHFLIPDAKSVWVGNHLFNFTIAQPRTSGTVRVRTPPFRLEATGTVVSMPGWRATDFSSSKPGILRT